MLLVFVFEIVFMILVKLQASLRPPKHADDDDGYLEFLGEDMEGTETPLVRVNGEEKSQLVRIEMTRRRRHSSLKLPFEQQELTAEKKKVCLANSVI